MSVTVVVVVLFRLGRLVNHRDLGQMVDTGMSHIGFRCVLRPES